MNSRQKARLEKMAPPQEEVEVESNIRVWWIVGVVSGLLLAAGSTYLVLRGMFVDLESRVFHFINNWPESYYQAFLVATISPESVWIPLAAVVATFLLKMYRATWELAAATLAGYALVFLGKEFIGRARPEDFVDNPLVRIAETGNGFPSGHTMIVTVVALVLLPYLPRFWRWLPLVLLVPVMALSRVYLGVHMPLDVVGGFAAGLLVVGAMRSLPRAWRRWLRFN